MARKKKTPSKKSQENVITVEDLVYEVHGRPYTDTLKVAAFFERRHDNIMARCRDILDDWADVGSLKPKARTQNRYYQPHFIQETRMVRGKEEPYYRLSKDAWYKVVMRLRGPKAAQLQDAFIERFNRMEAALQHRQAMYLLPEWQAARNDGKKVRLFETAQISKFVDYAEAGGSTGFKWYYANFTGMVYDALFDERHPPKNMPPIRDRCNAKQLRILAVLEERVGELVLELMDQKTPYSEIYQRVKGTISQIAASLGGPQQIGPLSLAGQQLTLGWE